MPDIDLGNYEIDEDSNGDLIIKDPNDNIVLQWDDSLGNWVFPANAPIDVAELIDGAGVSHTGELADEGDPGAHATQHEPGGTDEVNDIDIADSGTNLSAHASRHNADAADEVAIENLGTTGPTDTVPISQGDGTVAMDNVPGSDFVWTQDDNSPKTVTNTTNISYTLASSYDQVRVVVQLTSSGFFSSELTVNGDTGTNYSSIDQAGNISTGSSSFSINVNEAPQKDTYSFEMTGRFGDEFYVGQANVTEISGSIISGGKNDAISSPLSSFTISEGASTAADEITVNVYGRDVSV